MALVSIIMGSDSDLAVMSKAAKVLEDFNVEYEMRIISAHRQPDELFNYMKEADEKGIKVIIAGAGKAAALPGMCAALCQIPVIGIPMKTSDLGGVDSMYSIVQMPTGVPVATVAINGAANAGLLALKILGTSDETIKNRLNGYALRQKHDIEEKNAKLQKLGYEAYLNQD